MKLEFIKILYGFCGIIFIGLVIFVLVQFVSHAPREAPANKANTVCYSNGTEIYKGDIVHARRIVGGWSFTTVEGHKIVITGDCVIRTE